MISHLPDFYEHKWYFKIPEGLPQISAYDKRFTGWEPCQCCIDDKPFTGLVHFGTYRCEFWIYYINGYLASIYDSKTPAVFERATFTFYNTDTDYLNYQKFYFVEEIVYDFVNKSLNLEPKSRQRLIGPWRITAKGDKITDTHWFVKFPLNLPFLAWLKENDIDLLNYSDEDLELIRMRWKS